LFASAKDQTELLPVF